VKTLTPLCAVLLAVAWAPTAAADEAVYYAYERPPERPMEARDWRDVVGRLEVGYRGVFVTNPGFNVFSTQDYFSGASVALSHTLVARSRSSFAIGLAWDYGTSGATSRGAGASLAVHRLTVPLEGRLHFGPWGYAFARIAPGAAHERVELDDASASSTLAKSQWLFSADASVGYAVPVVPLAGRPGPGMRLWIQGDVGYSWVADQRLTLQPTQSSGSAEITDGIDLRTSLGLRGAFFRVAAAVSY
jgi:hypothetical protein